MSFSIKEGEIFGLLGPNGAGKTTAINTIIGIKTPDKGDVNIFGKDIKMCIRDSLYLHPH